MSISEGLIKTAKKILEQKLTAVQIFPGSPKSYFPGTKHTEADFKAMQNLNIPKFVHINYFVNPANDTAVIPKSIAENMIFCDKSTYGWHILIDGDANKGKAVAFVFFLESDHIRNLCTTGRTP